MVKVGDHIKTTRPIKRHIRSENTIGPDQWTFVFTALLGTTFKVAETSGEQAAFTIKAHRSGRLEPIATIWVLPEEYAVVEA